MMPEMFEVNVGMIWARLAVARGYCWVCRKVCGETAGTVISERSWDCKVALLELDRTVYRENPERPMDVRWLWMYDGIAKR
jgi:hypothetical protein